MLQHVLTFENVTLFITIRYSIIPMLHYSATFWGKWHTNGDTRP